MTKHDKTPKDTEAVLMALDQISQTIDVMTSVVGRLRTYMQEEASRTDRSRSDQQVDLHEEMRPDRVLH